MVQNNIFKLKNIITLHPTLLYVMLKLWFKSKHIFPTNLIKMKKNQNMHPWVIQNIWYLLTMQITNANTNAKYAIHGWLVPKYGQQ